MKFHKIPNFPDSGLFNHKVTSTSTFRERIPKLPTISYYVYRHKYKSMNIVFAGGAIVSIFSVFIPLIFVFETITQELPNMAVSHVFNKMENELLFITKLYHKLFFFINLIPYTFSRIIHPLGKVRKECITCLSKLKENDNEFLFDRSLALLRLLKRFLISCFTIMILLILLVPIQNKQD